MPTKFHESNIDWVFEDGWTVVQHDDSTWYRKHFQACGGSSAMDFVALQDQGEVGWLIEVKDFTTEPPLRSKDLVEIITKKARDTLAGLVAGAINANTEDEQDFFAHALTKRRLRVAFHCERPTRKRKLFNRLPDPADLKQKLRKSLRTIDKRVVVMDCSSTFSAVPRTTTWNPKKPGATP